MKMTHVTMIVGIVISIFGLVLYPWPVSTPEPEYYSDPQGFLFFSSEDVDRNRDGRVFMIVEDLSWQSGEASVRLWIDMPLVMEDSNDSVIFVLQVLHEMSNANVQVYETPIELFGGNKTIVSYLNADRCINSYLLIEMPRKNLTGMPNFYIDFLWKNVLWKRTYSEKHLIVPFNAVFPSFISDVNLPEGSRNGDGILIFDYTLETKLSIERPKDVTVSEIVPAADHYGLSYDKLWYTWDIKGRCNWTKYSSTAIVMDIEVDELRLNHEQLMSFSFLFLGIGIPTSLTPLLYEMGKKLEWKSVESRVRQRIGRQLRRLFASLSILCEMESVQVDPLSEKRRQESFEEQLSALASSEIKLNAKAKKNLLENFTRAFYASVIEVKMAYLADIEDRYSDFFDSELRASLMDMQDYLHGLSMSLRIRPAEDEDFLQSISEWIGKIVKEIARIRHKKIDMNF